PRTIRIADSIRRRCYWQVANLIRPQSFPQTSADIILVRNVLIYFPVSAQAKVMRDIIGRLRPGGLLLTGPNESSIARAAGLTTLRPTIHRKDTR
ncbi:MAG: CheR family methyltransferase, partial [Pseudomonadota bacterium]